jgi:hypothetical protein
VRLPAEGAFILEKLFANVANTGSQAGSAGQFI